MFYISRFECGIDFPQANASFGQQLFLNRALFYGQMQVIGVGAICLGTGQGTMLEHRVRGALLGRADKLFILEEGAVSIRFEKGVNYAIRAPGRILGWSFLVPPNRYTASAVTIAPSRLLVIKGPDFYDLVHKETKMGIKIMDNLAQVVSSRLKAFVDYY